MECFLGRFHDFSCSNAAEVQEAPFGEDQVGQGKEDFEFRKDEIRFSLRFCKPGARYRRGAR
jgi:hypothetical protein